MNIIVTVAVGILGYYIAKLLKLPAAGMTGSMISVGILNIVCSAAYLPTEIKMLTQAISGAYIGVQIQKKDVLQFKYLYKPIFLLLLLLTINTIVCGIIISMISEVDLVTALLSCVSGGVSDMSLISMDMGANSSIVAIMQMVRLIGTMLFFPIWIQKLSKKEITNEQKMEDTTVSISNGLNIWLNSIIKSNKGNLVLTSIIALLFGYLGFVIKMPSGVLVFSMISVALLNCFTLHAYMSNNIRVIAQILAGSLVGCSINQETINGASQLFIPAILLFVSYIIVNYVFGIICKKLKFLDFKSALFASCPAGVSDMALIAGELGADMKKTAIIQVARLVYSIGVMPMVIYVIISMYGG